MLIPINEEQTFYGIIEAAEKMGFSAKGVKGGLDAIDKIPLPAIAHVVLKNNYTIM